MGEAKRKQRMIAAEWRLLTAGAGLLRLPDASKKKQGTKPAKVFLFRWAT